VTLDKVPATDASAGGAASSVRMAEPGGRAVERKLTLAVTPGSDMIGVRPLFSGRSLGQGDNASFDVVLVAPDGRKRIAAAGLRYELLKVESRYQWYRQHGYWNYEPIKLTRRVADGSSMSPTASPAHCAAGDSGAATGWRSRPAMNGR
jgi:alpha-2-macroglobulin